MNHIHTAQDVHDHVLDNTGLEEEDVDIIEEGFGIRVVTNGLPPMAAGDLENELASLSPVHLEIRVDPRMPSGSDDNDEEATLSNAEEVTPNTKGEEVPIEDVNADDLPGKFDDMDPEEFVEAAEEFSQGIGNAVTAVGKQFTESLGQITQMQTEVMERTMRKMAQASMKHSKVELLQEGDTVEIELRKSGTAKGEVGAITNSTAADYEADWTDQYNFLCDVWAHNPDVERDDRVIEVLMSHSDAGQTYAFPESKVEPHPDSLLDVSGVGASKADALREAGYETIVHLRLASQSDLAEIEGIGNALAARIKADTGDVEDIVKDTDELVHVGYACPKCDESFSKNSPEAVEGYGDDETMFCSIDCLNDYYG